MTAATPWVTTLRAEIKSNPGRGWTVTPQSGKPKLTNRTADGARSVALLPIAWDEAQKDAIRNAVRAVAALVTERPDLPLKEAVALACPKGADLSSAERQLDWPSIVEAMIASRSDRRATTQRDLRHRLSKALITLQTVPAPRSGRELMQRYAADHFDQSLPAGGQGRKRHLGDVAALLRYAVQRHGAPAHWLPLEGDELQELIGSSDSTSGDALTPPVKPEQLAALLDHLEDAGKHELRLAVALVALFGLRPAELAALSWRDGQLRVASNVKRNKASMGKRTTDRLVLPLDLPGREGEGAKAAQLWAGGLVKLPTPILNQIKRLQSGEGGFKDVGDAFRQLLDRDQFWQNMVAATPGLTPYSLRHGWAWRAHKAYDRPLSVRDAAALMGHTPSTHHRHYGRWTDEAGLIDAVAALATPRKALSHQM